MWLSALLEISNHLNKQLLHRTTITPKHISSFFFPQTINTKIQNNLN